MTTYPRRLIAVSVVVAVVIAAGWYFLLWKPQSHQLRAAHRSHAAAEQKVGQLDSQLNGLRLLERRVGSDQALLQSLDAALPDRPSLDTALVQLHQAAASSGVGLSSVNPSTPIATASNGTASSSAAGPTITISMSATGTHAQVVRFLTDLSKLPRAFVVDSLQLSGTNVVTASISARIFYAGSPTP